MRARLKQFIHVNLEHLSARTRRAWGSSGSMRSATDAPGPAAAADEDEDHDEGGCDKDGDEVVSRKMVSSTNPTRRARPANSRIATPEALKGFMPPCRSPPATACMGFRSGRSHARPGQSAVNYFDCSLGAVRRASFVLNSMTTLLRGRSWHSAADWPDNCSSARDRLQKLRHSSPESSPLCWTDTAVPTAAVVRSRRSRDRTNTYPAAHRP